MFAGDRSRKQTLVDYGFRLPSALDNRPFNFEEFLGRIGQAVYVSATPGAWELERAQGVVVEQIIRPTGLLDPEVEVRPTKGQVDDLMTRCEGGGGKAPSGGQGGYPLLAFRKREKRERLYGTVRIFFTADV